jgi:hypothetical protein
MAPTKGVEERHAPVRAVPRSRRVAARKESGRPQGLAAPHTLAPPAYSNFIFNTPGE